MAKRKCVICGQTIEDNNDSIPYKGRFAHKKCFQSTIKIATTEKKKELKQKADTKKRKTSTKPKVESIKDAVSEEEYQQKIELFNYIRQLLGTEELSAKIYSLIKDYMEKYGFTYVGIHQALEYHYSILNKPIVGDCIGLVPYIYDKAQKNFNDVETIKNDVKDKQIDKMYKEKVIKIAPYKQKKVELLDITSIGGEAHE